LKYLARLPVTATIHLDQRVFYLVHATPRDPMDEYLPAEPALWNLRLANIDADFVCVGHTHLPMYLPLERLQLLNPGSVGQPRDGDPRAAYAVIDDIDAAIAGLNECGLSGELLELGSAILQRGGKPPAAGTGG
jgi:predicted phosphodiesterase